MMASVSILEVGLVVLSLVSLIRAGSVRLTQETPCRTGQSCRLKCSLVSGTNNNGFDFISDSTPIATCSTPTLCLTRFPGYSYTRQDASTSFLDIQAFSSVDVATWSCRDGGSGSPSPSISLVENTVPSGVLTFGDTCGSGVARSPASLNCSGLRPGVPPASLTLKDSSSNAASSSQTGSVTGTVTRGGQASCSVSWSAFPSYTLNISPVLCDVQVAPSVRTDGASQRTVRSGQSLPLTCTATGSPRPSLSWSRDEMQSNTPVDSITIQSSLTFTPEARDGKVQLVNCTANNSIGSGAASFTLQVQYPPSANPAITMSRNSVYLEGDDVTLTCRVTGGNPAVSSVNLTCPRHTNTSQGDVTRLQFTADRRDQGSCVCSASHVLGYTQTASVNISVHYAPDIHVNTSGSGQSQGKITLNCFAEGRPATYTFQPWLQTWGGQEVRREPGRLQGGHNNLTLTSYQDTGTYTCSVDNGIQDRQGQLQRTARINVTVQDAPQLPLPSDPPVQSGELGERVHLYRTLYSVPRLTNYTWLYNGSPLVTSTANLDVLVRLPVHGKLLDVQGHNVTLDVDVNENTIGVYRLTACNRIACNYTELSLVEAGPPHVPGAIISTTSTPNTVVLSWTPGNPGGNFFQWFHVQYRRQNNQEGEWSDISNVGNRSSSDRTLVTVTVEGLEPDTSYVFRVRAQNSRPEKNLSNYTMIFIASTSASPSIGGLVGGLVGGIIGLTVLIVVVVILFKRRSRSDEPSRKPIKDSVEVEHPDEKSSGLSNPSPEGSSHPIFDDVDEVPAPQGAVAYAVVQKKPKKNTAPVKNSGETYAQVMKKVGKKGKKSSKGKEEVYENVAMDTGKAAGKSGATFEASASSAPAREVHEDGCVYISVEDTTRRSADRPKPAKAKKPRNNPRNFEDDKVIYTDVDHTKKAPAMPDHDGEEDPK